MLFFISQLAEVIELDNITFYQIENPTIIKFYTPYCSHCQSFAPTFSKMSQENQELVFAQINCYKNREICQSNNIDQLPTLKYFVNGVQYTFKKERTKNNIIQWVHEMNQPFVIKRDEEQLQKIIKETKTFGYVVIKGNDQQFYEQMLAPFKGVLSLSFEQSSQKQIYAVQEGHKVIYDGDVSDSESVIKFIENHIIPICPILTPDLFGHFLLQNKQLILFSVSLFEHTKQLREYFHEISIKEQTVSDPKQIFAIMNNKVFDSLLYMFQGNEDPTIYILYDKDVYKADIGANSSKDEISNKIVQLRKQIADGVATKVELRQIGQDDQQQANLVKLINSAIFVILICIALFAIWFACKCIRKGASVNDEDENTDIQHYMSQKEQRNQYQQEKQSIAKKDD